MSVVKLHKRSVLYVALLSAMQSIPASSAVLEEVMVTAQKREQNLQDVGISVTAFSGDQMEALGFTNTTDIVSQTPSLQLYEFSPTLTVYNLRGVSQNSFGDSLEAPVAVYVDNAYVSSMGALNGQLFDTERVEVLRGPQGTLYGRNATAGLIHYISKAPTEEFEGRVSGTVGNYDLVEVEGVVSGPLSDSVLGRLAVKYTEQDGYLEWERSENANGDLQVHDDIRDAYGKNAIGVKSALQFNLTEKTDVILRVNYSKDDDVPSGAYVRSEAAPDPITGLGYYVDKNDEPFKFNADQEGAFDRELLSTTIELKHSINDSVEFMSITNYMDMDKTYIEDTEGLASGFPAAVFDTFYVDGNGQPVTVQSFFPDQPAGADLPVFVFGTDQEFQQISQEFRLSGGDEKLNWQAGLYYLDIDTDNSQTVQGLAAWWTGGPSVGFQPSSIATSTWEVETESWSVFGQFDYQLTDALMLTMGLRWTEDEKTNDFYSRYETKDGEVLLEEVDFGVVPVGPVCYSASVDTRCPGDVADKDAKYDYSDWAGKAQLDWVIDDDSLTYFAVSKGVKGGNWSTPSFPDSINIGGTDRLFHEEETLYSYEIGAKFTLADGLARFNTAVFYYDYKDYQAFSLINFVQNISNNDARVTGAEFELFLTPWEGWDFALGGSFLDSEVDGIETPTGLFIDTELPQAPEYSFNGLARYEFDFMSGSLSTQIDFNYSSEQWLEVTNAPLDKEDSYAVFNARLTYTSQNEDWKLSGWIKNLGDEEYRIYALDVAGAPQPFVNDVYASPRTYGLTATYNF
ncbi:TonB-dependent receptor [Dasania sp. GY-MA-18]|uniref:TonB-dependent receptor n=1 Tax=Dasania phycosphaerae TaxID=2950436 RepID=A0A9J6RK40_9GAMM|nr:MULTISPECIES: TonB-dependent receptor [Dasania]MCR8922344.1 TonB-dependent receptor [Dasania sp. GY-MA-18]MCZ0864772.1 TonB-dependent receptor [Dasania phycosphaerae]MCZ0868500.1 TonB-dependent receptor [Dasania phycosphaerae]